MNALLAAAAVSDLRTMRIPNALPVALALLAVPLAFPETAGEALARLGSIFFVAGFAGALWLRSVVGGGDMKLLTGVAFWIPLGDLATFAVCLGLAGALQGLGTLVWIRLAPNNPGPPADRRSPKMPYAVSIGAAGLCWSLMKLWQP